MIKLVLTDLDDTLIPHGADGVDAHGMAAIHALMDAGVHFGPVSGRPPASMGWMFHDDEACYATGAFANGQLIRIDGRLVHEETLDTPSLQQVADLLDGLEGAALALYDVDGPSGAALVTKHPERLRAYPDVFAEASGQFVPRVGEGPYVKANVHVAGDYDRRVAVRDQLRAACPKLDFVFPSTTAPLIDIAPHGWGKGSAVRVLARELGVGLDEVAVFGDSENDLDMLRAVPNSVAVANADAPVAAKARWHIGASADGAVADAFDQIAVAARTGEMPAFMR